MSVCLYHIWLLVFFVVTDAHYISSIPLIRYVRSV